MVLAAPTIPSSIAQWADWWWLVILPDLHLSVDGTHQIFPVRAPDTPVTVKVWHKNPDDGNTYVTVDISQFTNSKNQHFFRVETIIPESL